MDLFAVKKSHSLQSFVFSHKRTLHITTDPDRVAAAVKTYCIVATAHTDQFIE